MPNSVNYIVGILRNHAKVTVTENKKKGGGTLNIEFYDPEELFSLTHKLEKLWNDN